MLTHKALPVQIKGINEEARTLVAVASTEAVDRDGDIIRAAGWVLENFIKNPVIPWAHNYADLPVAKATRIWVENTQLMFEAQFPPAEDHPFADYVWRLYKGGYLRAFSVGFRPIERARMTDEQDRYVGTEYKRQELWEISACAVPANPEALVVMQAEGLVDAKEAAIAKALGAAGDGQRLQAMEKNLGELLEFKRAVEANAAEVAALLPEVQAGLDNAQAIAPANPDPGARPPAALSSETRALAALLLVRQIVSQSVTEQIKYHLGKVA